MKDRKTCNYKEIRVNAYNSDHGTTSAQNLPMASDLPPAKIVTTTYKAPAAVAFH